MHLQGHGHLTHAVLKISPLGWEAGVDREARTLSLLEATGIPAPRLLGVEASGQAGALLLLQTYLPGSNSPDTRSPLQRMRALGAAAARVHTTALPAGHGLPHIDRPVWGDPYIAERQEGRAPTTPLLEAAERLWANTPPPTGSQTLVHGDLHHGNALWQDDSIVALIDWDTSGIGHPGLDLGWARLEATVAYGTAAADHIVHGWTDVTGHDPDALAYWDLVAALQNPADIGHRTTGHAHGCVRLTVDPAWMVSFLSG